jgi:hypothetical protein
LKKRFVFRLFSARENLLDFRPRSHLYGDEPCPLVLQTDFSIIFPELLKITEFAMARRIIYSIFYMILFVILNQAKRKAITQRYTAASKRNRG